MGVAVVVVGDEEEDEVPSKGPPFEFELVGAWSTRGERDVLFLLSISCCYLIDMGEELT
jgi:hypothetical protein